MVNTHVIEWRLGFCKYICKNRGMVLESTVKGQALTCPLYLGGWVGEKGQRAGNGYRPGPGEEAGSTCQPNPTNQVPKSREVFEFLMLTKRP